MHGIHIINDPNGIPVVLTIDIRNLDPDVRPLVEELLTRMSIDAENAERREFLHMSGILANRAYSDDEPDYSDTPAYKACNPSPC